jgi:hypothetical protein
MRGMLEALALDLKVRGKLEVREAFIGSFTPAKKGGALWAKPSVATERRLCQWQTAMVFLPPYPRQVLRGMKWPCQVPPWLRLRKPELVRQCSDFEILSRAALALAA